MGLISGQENAIIGTMNPYKVGDSVYYYAIGLKPLYVLDVVGDWCTVGCRDDNGRIISSSVFGCLYGHLSFASF